MSKNTSIKWVSRLPMVTTLVAHSAFAGLWSGPANVLLNGQAAPPPSSPVCGLVLVAADEGPQIIFTELPAWAVVAAEPGEDAEITVPIHGASLGTEAALVVTSRGALGGRVSLGWNDAPPAVGEISATECRLTAITERAETNQMLRVRFRSQRGQGSALLKQLIVRTGTDDFSVSLWPGAGDVQVCPPRVLPHLRKALQDFLVEWDWRMQDGIGTERVQTAYPEAIRGVIERGDRLVADLEAQGQHQSLAIMRWRGVRLDWRRRADLRALDEQEGEKLWREVHQLRREVALSNPLLAGRRLAFIKHVPGIFSHQLTQYYGSCARPGGGVFVLERPGESMNIRPAVTTRLPQGSFQHCEVSPDGQRLLVSWCEVPTVPKNREECLDRFFHLYEIEVATGAMRPLTAGPYDDFAPRYLPGGGLVFISTRRGGFHRCGRGPCAVYTLCLADADGGNPRPISMHETHEWDPAVLADGRIAYTRWDYVDRNAVHYQQLWSARPDGSGVRILYGNNTLSPVGIWEPRPVPGSPLIMATAAAHHAMTAGSIILVDTSLEPDGPAPLTRLTPDALFPESEAPVKMEPSGAWSAAGVLSAAPQVPPEARRWPGHCYRTPLPLSEKHFVAAYSFDPLIGEPTWNRANMFGLYLMDAFGNKELLYRDLNISSLWPAWLAAQPPAPSIASNTEIHAPKEGVFLLQNVHEAWPGLGNTRITGLRVLQVLPKSTPHANTPPVGVAHAAPGRQVLGTVPVEADGSAAFKAPAQVALAFQALDEQGRAAQVMRSVVYLQPGETMSCVGCHEHRTRAPRSTHQPLAFRRPASAIQRGPEGSNPFSYPRLVQPVLDRHCVGCHQAGKPEAKVALTGEPQGKFTVSYNALAPRVSFAAWGGKDGDFRVVNSEPATQPGFFGVRGSEAAWRYFTDHYEVKLSAAEKDRIITWMDANASFYGTFDERDQTRQLRGEAIAGPALQ